MTDLATVYRILNQAETALAHTLDRCTIPGQPFTFARYDLACWRIRNETGPGFAARTPGNGDPGGGHGANVTLLRGDDNDEHGTAYSQPERLGLDTTDHTLDDLTHLEAAPLRLFRHTLAWAHHIDALPDNTTPAGLINDAPGRHHIIAWCRTRITHVLDDHTTAARCTVARFTDVHRQAEDLARLTRRWGYTPTTPTQPKHHDPDMLATDLTDTLCRSCLRVGRRETRYRGELCQWCYRFEHTEGFLPPADIIEVRGRYAAVTEAMVEPHRQRHRDRQRNTTRTPA